MFLTMLNFFAGGGGRNMAHFFNWLIFLMKNFKITIFDQKYFVWEFFRPQNLAQCTCLAAGDASNDIFKYFLTAKFRKLWKILSVLRALLAGNMAENSLLGVPKMKIYKEYVKTVVKPIFDACIMSTTSEATSITNTWTN